jgi:hypothetical protein
VCVVAVDAAALSKARQIARTLAAMRDINHDRPRLERFNKEQREQLAKRLTESEERLPQQMVMAYRQLILLSGDGDGGMELQSVDLGPARITDTVPMRVKDYLTANDRLLDGTLAPAALLSSRFHVMGEEDEAVEIDRLLGFFYRLPRLPRLGSPDVLRRCLVAGVESRIFGMASGSNWKASDAILRYGERIDPGEIQFQPGTWLVRASIMETLLADRGIAAAPTPSVPSSPSAPVDGAGDGAREVGGETTSPDPGRRTDPTSIRITVTGVPADKVRDVIKVAIFPLAAKGADVTTSFEIAASKADGLSRRDLDLVVREGLKQLGVEVVIRDNDDGPG